MLTTGIASIDGKSCASLHASLQQTGLVKSVVEWVASTRGAWHLRPGEAVPDVVVLDLAVDPTPYFTFAAQLRRVRPSVRIIACSGYEDVDSELLLQAMRTGVQDFISRPISIPKLEETLTRFMQELGEAETVERDKLILVLGAKGGVGTSTVAVNLAVQLAKIARNHVGLLDFGCPLGHVSLLLDLRPQFSIRDAVENLDRLDSHFLQGLLTAHNSGLDVLAGTSHADEWRQLPVASMARVLNVVQSSFDFVVTDFGSSYSSDWKPVLDTARVILLVAQADVPTLWALERHLSDLTALGVEPDRVRIVINRWQRRDDEALEKFEKNTKRSIFARIPNDFRQVSEAINLGTPLSRNHGDPLTARYHHLASSVAGVAPVKSPKRGSVLSLFGKKKE